MFSLADVYSAIEETGAGVNIWAHPLNDATTVEINGQYDIFINPYKCKTISSFQTKLIHEWGHCTTGCTHYVYSPYEMVERNEYRADKCAIERFLPWAEIKKAVSNGLTEYWQLADYFNLEEKFIRKAIHYYRNIKQYSFDEIA